MHVYSPTMRKCHLIGTATPGSCASCGSASAQSAHCCLCQFWFVDPHCPFGSHGAVARVARDRVLMGQCAVDTATHGPCHMCTTHMGQLSVGNAFHGPCPMCPTRMGQRAVGPGGETPPAEMHPRRRTAAPRTAGGDAPPPSRNTRRYIARRLTDSWHAPCGPVCAPSPLATVSATGTAHRRHQQTLAAENQGRGNRRGHGTRELELPAQ